MSADNWDICPACVHKAQATLEADRAAVMSTYGKIPVDDFDAARAELKEVNPEEFRTFREDYEIFITDGDVRVVYSGYCSECGVGTEFDELHPFWNPTQ